MTPEMIGRFKATRKEEGRADATVNRGLEVLRQAYRLAVKERRLSPGRCPNIEMLSVDNVRQGFFDKAEAEDLMQRFADPNVRDFVEWGFRTGRRDRSSWTLRIPGSITKNAKPRLLRLEGEVLAIMEPRLQARRLDCPLIFHRTTLGRVGQPMKDLGRLGKKALREANLPTGLIFHDLRRSAVRTLIRAGVDPAVAMKVSGHKTRSMLDRYNVISEDETAAAFTKADAYLSTQPRRSYRR